MRAPRNGVQDVATLRVSFARIILALWPLQYRRVKSTAFTSAAGAIAVIRIHG
jgi:hypothetical protein